MAPELETQNRVALNRKIYLSFKNVLLLVLSILFVQLVYYISIIKKPADVPQGMDIVLVYSVDSVRIPAGIRLARRCQAPYFMVSDKGLNDFQDQIKLYGSPGLAQILLDGKATTTDQNARFTAPMIRRLPVKTVLLVTSWYHMPRALFLARLYLLGSGVKVYPFPADTAPADWWREGIFWKEYAKFWGSLGRVGLAVIGIERRTMDSGGG